MSRAVPWRTRTRVPGGVAAAAMLAIALAGCTPPQGVEAATPTPEPSLSPSPEPSVSQSPSVGPSPTGTATTSIEGAPGQYFVGLPPGVTTIPDDAGSGGAGWSEAELQLYVVTIGSSTCPTVAIGVVGADVDSVTIEMAELGSDVCTMDMVPTTSVVEMPSAVSRTAELEVGLSDLGSVLLPPWAGEVELVWLPNA